MQWPIGVVVVLVLTVAANIYVAVRANDDPSVHVESDYYQKAVRFDADLALRRRSERLGWHVSLAATRTTAGEATVIAALVDSVGAPVQGAVVRFTARAVARANDSFTATAHPDSGRYVATMPMGRRGLWDVDIEAVRGGERFVAAQRLDLPDVR